MIAPREKAVYDERYYGHVFPAIGVFAVLAFTGYFLIIWGLPENIACSLNDIHWFIEIWPANLSNLRLLQSTTNSLDACRLIPATSYSALIGLLMFIDRLLYEIKYNERRNIAGILLSIIFFLGALLIWLPFDFINPTVMTKSNSFYSISLNHFDFFTELELLIFPFSAFFLLCESCSFALIYVRSKIDSWRHDG